MLTSPLCPFYLDAYSQSLSSLRYKILPILINYLVFRSICLNSYLVHFKNYLEYLKRKTIPVFIPLMTFPLKNLVWRSFLVRLRYFFLVFLSFPLVWLCPLLVFSSTSKFLFLRAFLFLAPVFLPLFVFFPILNMSIAHFYIQFHSYALVLFSYNFYQGLQFFFFFFFGKQVDVVHIYDVTYLYLRFNKFAISFALPKYVTEWHHCDL